MNRQVRRAVLRRLAQTSHERKARPMGIAFGLVHREYFDEEPDEWFELRDLGGFDLKRARDEKQRESRTSAKEWGSETYAVILRHWNEVSQTQSAEAPRDRLLDYDLYTILELGVAGWSLKRPQPDGSPDAFGDPIPVTMDNLRRLHEDTQNRLARRILKLSGVDSGPLPSTPATPSNSWASSTST